MKPKGIKSGDPGSIEGKYSEVRASILADYAAGGTAAKVGRRYRVPVHTVRELARRAGILRGRGGRGPNTARDERRAAKVSRFGHQHARDLSPAQRLEVVRHYQAGRPVTQIEAEYGVSAFSIRAWAKKLGKGIRPVVRENRRGRNSGKRRATPKPNGQIISVVEDIDSQLDALAAQILAKRLIKIMEALRDR